MVFVFSENFLLGYFLMKTQSQEDTRNDTLTITPLRRGFSLPAPSPSFSLFSYPSLPLLPG